MDCIKDPDTTEITFMTASQVGKSEVINNILGYFICEEPCPILFCLPTERLAQDYSKDRIAPMIRDSDILDSKFKDRRARDSENTIQHKKFTGGHLTLIGANSPAGLSSRPIRVLLCDEIDRWPLSAGAEGDPLDIVKGRTKNFHNAVKIYVSTPTEKGISRIERSFEESDKRIYKVPCPHCGFEQPLKWAQIKWPKDSEDKPLLDQTHYECVECEEGIDEAYKLSMLKKGYWEAQAEFSGHAGFHLNALYSPWVSWQTVAENFIKSKGDPESLKTWTNTDIAETWELKGEGVEDTPLLLRREQYTPDSLPAGVIYLTAGIDVQADRLECEIKGWGLNEENWSVDYKIIYGDTENQEIYNQMYAWICQGFTPAHGSELDVSGTAIDSGFRTETVYKFVQNKHKAASPVYAVKGIQGIGQPIANRPTKKTKRNIKVYSIGTDTAKARLYNRLKMVKAGPGFCHYPALGSHDEEYFKQLTAEKLVNRKSMGRETRVWINVYGRNEVLDCHVYAMAALSIRKPRLERIAKTIFENTDEPYEPPDDADSDDGESETPPKPNKSKGKNRGRRGSWLKKGLY